MAQKRNQASLRAHIADIGRLPQHADNSTVEDQVFSDIEDDAISVQSQVTITPRNISRIRGNDFANDSGMGSEVSTPVLERQMAGLGLKSDSQLPDMEIVEPLEGHTRVLTIVLLHSNGSSSAELKYQLLDAIKCSSGKTLQQELPGLRWIFPTAPILDHVKADKTVEQRRMWVDFGIHEEEGESVGNMYGSLRFTTETIVKIVESVGKSIGIEKQIRDKVAWEHKEIVFGGYWQSAAPAMFAWMCSGMNFAGFMGIRGVLPDQEPITQKYNEDVANRRPPGRGSDFDQHTHDFITTWTGMVTRENNAFARKMASTPVLLTLHESDTHWLFDGEKLARSLYNTLLGSANNLFTKCVGSPFTSQPEKEGITVEELDAIKTYLRCLTLSRKGEYSATFGEWIKKLLDLV